MQVLPNGSYKLADGRVVQPHELVNLHKTAPLAEEAVKPQEKKDELKEGQCSGPIQLLD